MADLSSELAEARYPSFAGPLTNYKSYVNRIFLLTDLYTELLEL